MASSSTRQSRPWIGINTDYYCPKNGVAYTRLNTAYLDMVLDCGGLPLILPPMRKDNQAEFDAMLDMVSGVIMTGGKDLDPKRFGQQMINAVQPMQQRREDADRYLLSKVMEKQLPLLAIGVGMQLLNIHQGGSLFLHLPSENARAMPHFDPTGAAHRHMVNVEPKTTLEDIFGTIELRVNSMHHQAVNQVGRQLRVAAKAPDGVIEAIETTEEGWFCIGVQWHPESDTASALDRQLFDCHIQAAMQYAEEPIYANV